ncbi:MAG: FkbM family methyltransferase [Leptospirales bacterium]
MKSALSQLVFKTFRRFGLHVIPEWRWKDYDIANHTRDLFHFLGIDCVLDVGANKGQYAYFLKTYVGYTGMILSFEPVPEIYEALEKRARFDPFWKVFPCALGAQIQNLPINVMKGETLNSFLSPIHGYLKDIDDYNEVSRTEMVPVRTVDSVLEECDSAHGYRSIFLKMDTQGFDQEVLKGATESLFRISAFQSEISCLPIYKEMTDYIQSLSIFRDKGFNVTGMFPIVRDKWFRVLEFDCLAVNTGWLKEHSISGKTEDSGTLDGKRNV